MGEIIKFDFQKNIENKKAIENSSVDEKSNSKIIKFNPNSKSTIGEYEKNLLEKKPETSKLVPFFRFVDFVASDKYHILMELPTTPLALKQNKEIVEKYTNEELISWLKDNHEKEWIVKPSFFQAIVSELKIRLPKRPTGPFKE